jgi:hypothetical protein
MENFPFKITVMPGKKTWINNNKIHIFTGALFVKKGTTPKMVLINVEKNVGITSCLTRTPKRRRRSANYHKLWDIIHDIKHIWKTYFGRGFGQIRVKTVTVCREGFPFLMSVVITTNG